LRFLLAMLCAVTDAGDAAEVEKATRSANTSPRQAILAGQFFPEELPAHRRVDTSTAQ
jgi:hypothetical protein